MKTLSILFLSCLALLGWELKGIQGDVNLSELNLSDNIIWAYENGEWKTSYNTSRYTQLRRLTGGMGYWMYKSSNIQTPNQNDNYQWSEGWNLVSPIFEDWNMSEKFKNHALVAWKYENKEWKLYSTIGYFGYTAFNNLTIGEGAWVYLKSIDIKMNNQPIFCENGTCSKIITTNHNYTFSIKTDKFNSDLKFAFDLYRYSNNIHYKLAFGPFQIDQNGIKTENIRVCVQKGNTTDSCKPIDNTNEHFLDYKDGYLFVDAQKIAQSFNRTIPNTKEKFKMKIFIEGFDVAGFKNDQDFGTLGIEDPDDSYGVWVKLSNNKSIEFEMEIR